MKRLVTALLVSLVLLTACSAPAPPTPTPAPTPELAQEPGDLLWRYETGERVFSSPTVAGGTVYVGSLDNYLYAISTSVGDAGIPWFWWIFMVIACVIAIPVVWKLFSR